ncbi:type 1 glutamine amidotransferase [Halorubrum sp. CSM-61]|uniref:type 1 glutamine amidotransferase n=1 Tax=Halorubrum sp. CSM-61 TaxID=2485838 RepID=UPI000F4B7A7C|nr:type 1 glutamine amidotransferase [Halorubrum sp. CSM-61]
MTTGNADPPALYVVRNEVDPDCEFHCDALAAGFPDAEAVDFVAGDRVPLDEADGVVLTGSTAAVYEADSRPWIAEQEAFVRELVDREVPTLGVCFGHQVVNSALGGTVEKVGTTAGLVEATLADDPLFDGVGPIVASLHGDAVTDPGAGMEVIASAPHARVFGTRHRSAPLWTFQFHPELDASHRDLLVEKYDWESGGHSFEDVTAGRVFENFRALVRARTA